MSDVTVQVKVTLLLRARVGVGGVITMSLGGGAAWEIYKNVLHSLPSSFSEMRKREREGGRERERGRKRRHHKYM